MGYVLMGHDSWLAGRPLTSFGAPVPAVERSQRQGASHE